MINHICNYRIAFLITDNKQEIDKYHILSIIKFAVV